MYTLYTVTDISSSMTITQFFTIVGGGGGHTWMMLQACQDLILYFSLNTGK